jgi:hypothetical protein
MHSPNPSGHLPANPQRTGGSLAALALLPKRAPLPGCAMSGALCGLFAMATLFNSGKSWHWHRWFEMAALLPFVALQLTGAHAGLAQWATLHGLRLPAAWVPLLGGLAGAAVAAALLQLGRIVAAGIQQRRQQQYQQQQQAAGQQPGGPGPGREQQLEPVTALLSRAATLLLKRLV